MLLRFSNRPTALKISTALRWRVRMLPEVQCDDRDVAPFSLGKELFRASLHSPDGLPSIKM